MENKQLLLDAFHSELCDTTWLIERDQVYANKYFSLLDTLSQPTTISDDIADVYIDNISDLRSFYFERAKSSSTWVAPKKQAPNELFHDENGNLTAVSIDTLKKAIVGEADYKTLISDTGKTISFGNKWYKMINSCSFKDVAIEKLTDFICKLTEENGWLKYFDGNIGKNNQQQVQYYHPMDKYNKDNPTKYAALHLGGNTRRCVLASVDTGTIDGRGEPNKITFLEIGAHTIIDPYKVEGFALKQGKPITEATTEDLAELLDIK